MNKNTSLEGCFIGSATVGDRGQIVIPADARHSMGIGPGDKLLIMRHPVMQGLIMFKIDAFREYVDMLQDVAARTTDEEPA